MCLDQPQVNGKENRSVVVHDQFVIFEERAERSLDDHVANNRGRDEGCIRHQTTVNVSNNAEEHGHPEVPNTINVHAQTLWCESCTNMRPGSGFRIIQNTTVWKAMTPTRAMGTADVWNAPESVVQTRKSRAPLTHTPERPAFCPVPRWWMLVPCAHLNPVPLEHRPRQTGSRRAIRQIKFDNADVGTKPHHRIVRPGRSTWRRRWSGEEHSRTTGRSAPDDHSVAACSESSSTNLGLEPSDVVEGIGRVHRC